MGGASFCYAQARLQARHGARPDEAAWQALEAARSFSHYLDRTRSGGLARFTQRIGVADEGHGVEQKLREARRAYAGEVARWVPRPWQEAVSWCALWPELPLLSYLLDGGDAKPWMASDALLGPLAAGGPSTRQERLQGIGLTGLVGAAQGTEERGIAVLWLEHWRGLWPACPADQQRHLETLITAVGNSFERLGRTDPGSNSAAIRRELATRLTLVLRAASPGPVAVVCHLGLVALDIERLRGGLLFRRSLRVDAPSEAA